MADSNRNVAARAIKLCARLATATGPHFASSGRLVVAPVLKNIGDGKPNVRAAVAEFVTAMITACGWASIEDKMAVALAASSGVGKNTVLECYAALLQSAAAPRKESDVLVVVQACAFGLTDKMSEPRKLATELLNALLDTPAQPHAAPAAARLPAAQSALVSDVLAKAGVGPAPPSAPASRPATAGAGRRAPTPTSRAGAVASQRAPRSTAGALPRPGTSKTRPASAGPGSARSAAALQDANAAPLVAMVDASEKSKRIVPPRSFKFEMRQGEAAEVKKELSQHVNAGLAALMFSTDWHNHCTAAERLEVRLRVFLV